MSGVKINVINICRSVYDSIKKAINVSIVDTEMSIELNHADGDSVTSHPAKLVASANGITSEDNGAIIIPALDCSSIRKMDVHVEGSGSVTVLVSPTDSGDYFVEHLGSEVNARRVKVVSIDVIGNVHLVGRS